MGFASGSEYAQETWDIVREFIPEKQRPEVARKFYEYWQNLDADSWNPYSNLLQDTELDEFKLQGLRTSPIDKVFIVQELLKQGKQVYWHDDTNNEYEYRGLVKYIEVEGENSIVSGVIINGQKIPAFMLDKIIWEYHQ